MSGLPARWALGTMLLWTTALGGCQPEGPEDPVLAHAELIMDAFYSYDPVPLRATLENVEASGSALYYQAWAQAAHYEIQTRRPCSYANATTVQCAITVTDDFGKTLGYTATDTFVLSVEGGQISEIKFISDDPPIFNELLSWMATEQPEVMWGPCKDSFAGGSTPAECARAVAAAAKIYVNLSAEQPNPTELPTSEAPQSKETQ